MIQIRCSESGSNRLHQSPIAVLINDILRSIAAIAPEKIEGLQKAFQEYKVSLVITDEGFSTDTAKGEIYLGIGKLERIWAAAHAYVQFCDYMVKAKRVTPNLTEVSLRSDPALDQAVQLLSWAIDWELHLIPVEDAPRPPFWPEGLPRPNASNQLSAENELFFCAVAVHLHHELAHIIGLHEPTRSIPAEVSVSQEKEADVGAIDWILDGLPETDGRFKKRVLGIALAFVWPATILFFRQKAPTFHTHPPAYQRLLQAMERHWPDHCGSGWSSLSTFLSVFTSNRHIPGFDPYKVHKTPHDFVIYCFDLLAKQIDKAQKEGTSVCGSTISQ